MLPILESLFAECASLGASDIHLTTNQPPRFRVRGRLSPRPDLMSFNGEQVDEIAMETAPDGARYRFNLFREANTTAIAMRRLDNTFRSMSELGLPRSIAEFCKQRDGLVIVSGPTGSGKSTTLATLLNGINRTHEGYIITIEDPIEFVHTSERCLVSQRQVGRDAKSFNDALVEAMRQDPDVILVGEIRDLETIRTAIRAAETGHLVFTTLHASDCAGVIERIVAVYPAEEQNTIRHQLALCLRGGCISEQTAFAMTRNHETLKRRLFGEATAV